MQPQPVNDVAGPRSDIGGPQMDALRRELSGKLEALMKERVVAKEYLMMQKPTGEELELLEGRMGVVDEQIKLIEFQLRGLTPAADVSALSTAAAPVRPELPTLPREYVWLGGLLILVAFLPLSVALARRIWRRGEIAVSPVSLELESQLAQMKTAVESVALEVERIGEGQRYVTGLIHAQLGSAESEARPRMPAAVLKHDSRNAVTPH